MKVSALRPNGMTVVAVGQVWEDNDPRSKGRRLRVVDVLPNGAVLENIATGRKTGALLKRFGKASGYTLVEAGATADAVVAPDALTTSV